MAKPAPRLHALRLRPFQGAAKAETDAERERDEHNAAIAADIIAATRAAAAQPVQLRTKADFEAELRAHPLRAALSAPRAKIPAVLREYKGDRVALLSLLRSGRQCGLLATPENLGLYKVLQLMEARGKKQDLRKRIDASISKKWAALVPDPDTVCTTLEKTSELRALARFASVRQPHRPLRGLMGALRAAQSATEMRAGLARFELLERAARTAAAAASADDATLQEAKAELAEVEAEAAAVAEAEAAAAAGDAAHEARIEKLKADAEKARCAAAISQAAADMFKPALVMEHDALATNSLAVCALCRTWLLIPLHAQAVPSRAFCSVCGEEQAMEAAPPLPPLPAAAPAATPLLFPSAAAAAASS